MVTVKRVGRVSEDGAIEGFELSDVKSAETSDHFIRLLQKRDGYISHSEALKGCYRRYNTVREFHEMIKELKERGVISVEAVRRSTYYRLTDVTDQTNIISQNVDQLLTANSYVLQNTVPVRIVSNFWVYRNSVVQVLLNEYHPDEEVILEIKKSILKFEKRLSDLEMEVAALEGLERENRSDRPHIPQEVRLFVWRRDQGRCQQCGSNKNLEFDHIIPISRGGSNTARNIQLLCEVCNRAKSDNI